MRLISLLVLLFFTSLSLVVAQRTVTGVVKTNSGDEMIGVNVIETGTSNGTITDIDGSFSLQVQDGATLTFSFTGFQSQEVAVNNQSVFDIALSEGSLLNEVVVTALGIKRERKSLGYSVEEVKGQSLIETREASVVNALSGQISGLQVVKGSNGPAGSSKIILRGFNSLTGDNQPLIVVDGVPLDNFTGATNNDFWNPSSDFGNGLGDINTEDIESLSVLKGASAAALYGSRAGNGVILITTKTGKKKEGLGINYSVTTGVQSMFIRPELQTTFAQGVEGISDPLSTSSWGPRIGSGEQTFDNLGNYYKDGFSQNHSLSFQNQIGKGSSIYTSANYLKDDSNIPGAVLERLNLLVRGVSKFGPDESWTLDTKVQYNQTTAKNRPRNGRNSFNAFGTILTLPSTVDITEFSAGSDEFGNQIWYDPTTTQINPYWSLANNLSEDSRDRFVLSGSLNYKFNDWLSSEIKMGADIYTTNTESRLFSGSPSSTTGRFSLGKNVFVERNYSALLVAEQDNIFGKLGGSLTLGGNLMSTERSGISGNSGDLVVPNLFSLNNGVNPPGIGQSFSNKKINSFYGLLQLNYDGFLFVDVTGRNDWTSSLSKENRSFFYPSFNASWVISDMIEKGGANLPSWFNFGKVRASYAEVGNDLSPFRLVNAFFIGNDPRGATTARTGSTLFDPNVVNELIKSLEFGFEARFLNNRVGLDFTWYKSNATNQLIPIPLDPLSGFNNRIINAGDIQNKGIEVTLKNRILMAKNGFSWDLNLNYSRNKNTIEELTGDVTQFSLGGFDNLSILANVNEDYGVIWGSTYARVEDETSEHFGRILVDSDGLPLAGDREILGTQQPDALVNVTNLFQYKNFSFGFLLSASLGGEIFSGTNRQLQGSGLAAVTAVNGEREDVIFDGVISDGAEGFVENTVGTSPQRLWGAITQRSGNVGINEANIYDATHIRLRNITLDYKFPTTILGKTPFTGLKIGVSASNVWMIRSHLNGVDPESIFATGTNAIGFENLSSPTTRTIFFNLSVNF